MAVLLDEAYPTIHDLLWKACPHEQTAIRWRIRANKIGVYVEQCLTCGNELRAVRKEDSRVRMLAERAAFDETIRGEWERRQKAAYEDYRRRAGAEWEAQRQADESERAAQNAEWWKWYTAYLKTPAWRSKRTQVLERANGMCEGCRRRKADQVHHLTYEHAGDEFLFELVAICNACHHRLHPDME